LTAVPVRWLTVFLDFPAASFGAGVAFWREVTGSGLSPARGAGHAAAGARILAVLPHETEMADPVGRFYRLTGREMAE